LRAPHVALAPNIWGVTGGHVNAGETSIDAAIRETKEEIGLSVTKEELCFVATFKKQWDDETQETLNIFRDTYLVKKDIELSRLQLQEEEVSQVKWINILDLVDCVENKTIDIISYGKEYFEVLAAIIN
jgi:8-oxo-dGTP pyrophosphatase MutT (NUDIX family)